MNCVVEGALNEDTARQYDDSKRDLERGSKIVGIVPNGVRVVLQVFFIYIPFFFMR